MALAARQNSKTSAASRTGCVSNIGQAPAQRETILSIDSNASELLEGALGMAALGLAYRWARA